jgi:hypothetical protein
MEGSNTQGKSLLKELWTCHHIISEHFGGKKIIRTFAPANTQGNLSRDKSLAIH